MSKMIQVRNVPDQLHRKLKARAAKQGMSLSDFILEELKRVSATMSLAELIERSRHVTRPDLDPSPAELIREDRDSR